MTPFFCTRCQQPVFFENTRCEPCGALLGFVPEQRRMVSFEADEAGGVWHSLGITPALRRRPCVNYAVHNVCNWMVPEGALPQTGGDGEGRERFGEFAGNRVGHANVLLLRVLKPPSGASN